MSDNGRWGGERYTAGDNNGGVNAITWAPALPTDAHLCPTPTGLSAPPLSTSPTGTNTSSGTTGTNNSASVGSQTVEAAVAAAKKRLAVGCCDGTVRLFEYNEGLRQWTQAQLVGTHSDWVRSVAWAPSVTSLRPRIASCAQDGSAAVWAFDHTCGRWNQTPLVGQQGEVAAAAGGAWHVEWNESGTALALTAGDGKVSLWMEATDGSGEWKQVNVLEEPPGTEAAAPSMGNGFGSQTGLSQPVGSSSSSSQHQFLF